MGKGKQAQGVKKSRKAISPAQGDLLKTLNDFKSNDHITEFEFAATLLPHQRSFVNAEAMKLGLVARCEGIKTDRRIIVSKKAVPLDSSFPQAIESSFPQAVESSFPQAVESSFPQAVESSFPQEIESTFPLHVEKTSMAQIKSVLKINFSHPEIDRSYDGSTVARSQAVIRNIPPVLRTSNDIVALRNQLPARQSEHQIREGISTSQVLIVEGSTGSGKSTQVPQIILESSTIPVKIMVTQPRRIAAISVAERVAFERSEAVGDVVSYHVRGLNTTTARTDCLTVCTTGILLRMLVGDIRCLGEITHLILDEAHERGVDPDFLLGIVKPLLTNYPDLRLILMSAGMNSNMYSTFFKGSSCNHITIPGKHHNVAVHFLEEVIQKVKFLPKKKRGFDKEKDAHELIASLIKYIDQQHPVRREEAVLVFLPGCGEISNVQKLIEKIPNLQVHSLHSNVEIGTQKGVFSRPESGNRKVVLATNVAETSVTIDDIVYVIDTGKVKVNTFRGSSQVSHLKTENISRASSEQRKGRAGRCSDGICFRLYSKSDYESFKEYPTPEIRRVQLEPLCLQSTMLLPPGRTIAEFLSALPEAPALKEIERSVKMLQSMDAIDSCERITQLGHLLLKFPVHPRLGKMIVTSVFLRCVDPVLTIVSYLSSADPFFRPTEQGLQDAASARKFKLARGTKSDHYIFLRLFDLWLEARQKGPHFETKFAADYCVTVSRMEEISMNRDQFLNQLMDLIPDMSVVNTNKTKWVAIKAAILSGSYPQIARVDTSGNVDTRGKPKVTLNRNSVLSGNKDCLAKLSSQWIMYEELFQYEQRPAELKHATLVSPLMLALFGGSSLIGNDGLHSDSSKLFQNGGTGSCSTNSSSSVKIPNSGSPLRSSIPQESDIVTSPKKSAEAIDGPHFRSPNSSTKRSPLPDSVNRSPLADISSHITPKRSLPADGIQSEPESSNQGSLSSSKKRKMTPMCNLNLDEWIQLKGEIENMRDIYRYRHLLMALFFRRMKHLVGPSSLEDALLDSLMIVLEVEENKARLLPSLEISD